MNKKYVEAMIRFLENVQPDNEISSERGHNLCGDYWDVIRKDLDRSVLMLFEGGGAYVHGDELSATLIKYRDLLTAIEKEEYDRELRNLESEYNIKVAKHAVSRSWWAIGISIASLIIAVLTLLAMTLWK